MINDRHHRRRNQEGTLAELISATSDQISFLSTCTPKESNFQIQLVNMGEQVSASSNIIAATNTNAINNIDRYQRALERAAERWQLVIVGDLPGFAEGLVDDWFGGTFAPRTFNGAVDDLVIGFEIAPTIDGPGGVLGSAGPVFVRTGGPGDGRPISGIMRFDGADLDRMSIEDVEIIMIHEMGHVLGLVGTTGLCTTACDNNAPNQQFPYECQDASLAYQNLPDTPNNELVLENQGGQGTACGHWEEDAFRGPQSSEIMTGFFEANLFQPLSLVTVAALRDLQYEVDFCGADVWPATDSQGRFWQVYQNSNQTSTGLPTTEDPERLQPKWGVDEDGEVIPWDEAAPLDDDDDGNETDTSPTSSPNEQGTAEPDDEADLDAEEPTSWAILSRAPAFLSSAVVLASSTVLFLPLVSS